MFHAEPNGSSELCGAGQQAWGLDNEVLVRNDDVDVLVTAGRKWSLTDRHLTNGRSGTKMADLVCDHGKQLVHEGTAAPCRDEVKTGQRLGDSNRVTARNGAVTRQLVDARSAATSC